MHKELIRVSVDMDISLYYADNIPVSLVRTVAVPAAVKAFGELTKSGSVAKSVFVEMSELIKLKIVYYREHGHVIREDIIPLIATTDAQQHDIPRSARGHATIDDPQQGVPANAACSLAA